MPEPAPEGQGLDPAAMMRSRQFVVLLVLAAIVGVVVSLASWGFLELESHLRTWIYTDLPGDVGFDGGAPLWWSLPVLAIAGVIVAFAIVRLPGGGGHIPAYGLNASSTEPVDLPGVMLAGVAGVGLGVVLGPEAPLLALGGGLGLLMIRTVRRDAPSEVGMVLAAAGSFSALSLIFGNPLIAAVILIEAIGLGGPKLPLVLVPGLLAAGIGSLVSLGLGSWTGLSNSAYALGALPLPAFDRPDVADFGWSILLAAGLAVLAWAIFRLARETLRFSTRRPFVVLPVVGLLVGGLAIAFHGAADESVYNVLFSGQEALPGFVSGAGTWSVGALLLLLAFKGAAYGLSLGSFRGGPVFPAIFLGAAGGVLASHLPGFDLTPAVAVGMGAGLAAVLKLPLSGIVVATLLISQSGPGSTPLVIVGVVVAYLVTIALPQAGPVETADPSPAASTAAT